MKSWYKSALRRQGAFAEIVRRYQKQIYSLAYRLTNHMEDAQDLAQEIFIKLYQVLDKYDTQKPFFPWMYKVATNVCYTLLRKRPADEVPLEKVIEFGPIVLQSQNQPEERYEAKEMQLLVQQAIAQLPEKYRIPLVLRYLEEFSYRQIAEIMDLPLTTIELVFTGQGPVTEKIDPILQRGSTMKCQDAKPLIFSYLDEHLSVLWQSPLCSPVQLSPLSAGDGTGQADHSL